MICGNCEDATPFWILGSGCDGLALLLAFAYEQSHIHRRPVIFRQYWPPLTFRGGKATKRQTLEEIRQETLVNNISPSLREHIALALRQGLTKRDINALVRDGLWHLGYGETPEGIALYLRSL